MSWFSCGLFGSAKSSKVGTKAPIKVHGWASAGKHGGVERSEKRNITT